MDPALRALEESGWALLPAALDAAALAALRQEFREGPEFGASPAAAPCLAHPRVLACARAVVGGAVRVLYVNGRNPAAGHGQQGLHQDQPLRGPGESFRGLTALWLLDDFRADNGPTRLVPGSHRAPRALPKSQQAPAARHAEELRVRASAGDVLLLNAHLWHGGTRNLSGAPRRVLQVQYVSA